MKTVKNKVTKILVGKGEAGTALYKDTGLSIEIGDTAYTIEKENFFDGGTETLYFKEKNNAETYE